MKACDITQLKQEIFEELKQEIFEELKSQLTIFIEGKFEEMNNSTVT